MISRDVLNRVLYRTPAKLWIRHWLSQVGDREDLEQTATCVLLEPRWAEYISQERFHYLSGVVAHRLKRDVRITGGTRKRISLGKHEQLSKPLYQECEWDETKGVRPSYFPRNWETSTLESRDLTPLDPFDMIKDESDRELARDYFYAKGRKDALKEVLVKWGISTTRNLRRQVKRILEIVRRQDNILAAQLR